MLLSGVLVSGLLSGCKDFLEIESPHIINEENNYKSLNDVRSGLLGVYNLLRTAMTNSNAHFMYGELRAGDFQVNSSQELEAIASSNLKADYKIVHDLSNWRRIYAVINAANIFIEKSPIVVTLDKQYSVMMNEIDIAQMRGIKAFCYFILARTWGDVPIWEKSHEGGEFPKLSQSSAEDVLDYAKTELKEVLNKLPYLYGSVNDPVYPYEFYYGQRSGYWAGILLNRNSTLGILAHLTAWQGKYDETVLYTGEFLSNASQSGAVPVTNALFDDLFGFPSGSHVFSFPSVYGLGEFSATDHIENLTLAEPYANRSSPEIYIAQNLVSSLFVFPNDVRYFIDDEDNISSLYFGQGFSKLIFKKIATSIGSDGVTTGGADLSNLPMYSSSVVFTRYEDLYLLHAEALYANGEPQNSIRSFIRERLLARGVLAVDIDAYSTNILDFLFEERHRELLGEGSRWFDLIRYKKLKNNDPAFNQLIQDKGIFWPIDKEVLDANSNLKQNPYWN